MYILVPTPTNQLTRLHTSAPYIGSARYVTSANTNFKTGNMKTVPSFKKKKNFLNLRVEKCYEKCNTTKTLDNPETLDTLDNSNEEDSFSSPIWRRHITGSGSRPPINANVYIASKTLGKFDKKKLLNFNIEKNRRRTRRHNTAEL